MAMTGTGLFVLRRVRLDFSGYLQTILFATGIGYALITNILFFIGLVGMLNKLTALVVLFISLTIAIIQFSSEFRTFDHHSFNIPLNYFERFLLVLLSILIIMNCIGALAPPSVGDSLRHHLAAPKLYSQLGGFPFIPISPWPAPGLLHVLYTQAMLLANGIACQLICCVFGVFTMLAVFALTSRYFGSVTGLISAAIFYSLPITTELSTGAMVELGAAFCAVLGLWALLKAGPEFDTRWIVLAGVLGGCAGATKLWALTCGPAFVVVIFILAGKRFFEHPRNILHALLVFSLAYGVILAPWFIRNYLASGNPIWPIGYSFFDTQYWSEVSVLKYSRWSRGPGTSFWHYLLGPWYLTNNIAAFNAGYGIFASSMLNPLLLAFIPGAILFRKKFDLVARRFLSALGIFCLVVYTIWFLGGYHHPRYLQLVHPFLSVIAGVGIVTFLKPIHGYFKKIINGILGFTFTFMLGIALLLNIKYFPVVFGSITPEEYLQEKVPHFSGVQWVNNNLPDNSKVLYAGTAAWYYLDKDYIPLAWRNIDYNSFNTPSELKNTLIELGITHILIEGDPQDGGATLQDVGSDEINHIRELNLHTLTDFNNWLITKPEDIPVNQITYATIRPFILMRAMELNGDLFQLKLIKTKVITSRTKGTYRESEVAVYELL
ncbi:MAG: glycosyltransferase family 39 protein [Bacteroidales bacterium]|nr:glycosyltransferase family 39 protein [Bacteroidales bacterium]